MNKRNIIIIVSILVFVMIVGGVSYSYFVYNKDVGDISLTAGEISITLSGVNGNQTFSNMIPMTDYEGMNSNSYFDFTVNGTVDTERIYYEVYILPDSENTLDTGYLKTYLTDQSNNEINGVTIYNDLYSSEVENGKVLYKGIVEVNNNGTPRTETKDFRLRLWLDESYTPQTSKVFDFDVYLYAKNVDKDFVIPYGANLLRKAIEEKEALGGSCNNPTWTDTEDNIAYLSGTNDCIDMNYVWYSGKLWRIIAIYPDGRMKMITQDVMTDIHWGSNVYFSMSGVYHWLNEEFSDTLVNTDGIIDETTWNYSISTGAGRPENITNQLTTNGKYGLLNAYEYYNAGRNGTTYLNIGYWWWLLNPYSNNNVQFVLYYGGRSNRSIYDGASEMGVRPVIVIKANLEFAGNGTIDNPYTIIGDKEKATNNVTLINSRSVGEYVKFDNDTYRIVNTYDSKTKLIRDDYLREGETVITKNRSSDVFGKVTNTQTDDYWDYYLNNSWYNSISTTYRNMLVDDIYYLGLSTQYGRGYKNTICVDASTGTSTRDCEKYTSNDIDKTFVGKVGLIRIGEIFASQNGSGYTTSSSHLTITPGKCINQNGGASNTLTAAVRPTITLKSGIKITSGTGTKNDPFEISE